MSLTTELRAAYDVAGQAWAEGPSRLYTELARPLVDAAGDVSGLLALDIGTGAGAVAALLEERGAGVFACDSSLGMLRPGAAARPPAVVADVQSLPVRRAAVDLVTAGFVLNHLPDPVPALREAARVLRPEGRLVATTFAGEAAADVKRRLEVVAARHGFVAPRWHARLHGAPLCQPTPQAVRDLATRAGLTAVVACVVEVHVALSVEQVLAWRWGMAQLAGFVTGLGAEQRRALDAEAGAELEGLQPLVFPVLVLVAQNASPSSD